MPRRWIRIAAFALLFIALGAITTTAVAWGIALSSTYERFIARRRQFKMLWLSRNPEQPELFDGFMYWPGMDSPGETELGLTRIQAVFTHNLNGHSLSAIPVGPPLSFMLPVPSRWVTERPMRLVRPGLRTIDILERRYGWPTRSHWFYSEQQGSEFASTRFCEGIWRFPRQIDSIVDVAASNGRQPDNAPKSFWLPIYILPLGFTLNTLFYAAAWCVPLIGIRAARRTLSRRRGLCTRCAYDLNGLAPGAPCPECGSARSRYKSLEPPTSLAR
jgi:hypothetical protein